MSQPALVLNFRDAIDIPQWRSLANAITTSAAGMYMAYDMRNDKSCHPVAYFLTSNTAFSAYNYKNDEWFSLASPALAGTFGAGAAAVFHPSQGPRGTLTTGSTATTVNLSTALPASVGVNQLANNNGTGQGFRIRIIGNHAAGSGKTEEAYIIANTSGTTPTITLDRTLSFTPASGDAYEIDSGRIFLLGAGANAAGQWKYYDIATNSYSGNLSVANLPATISSDTTLVALSEAYVPYNLSPGNGMVVGASTYSATTGVADGIQNIKCLLATGSSATSITGQATSGDAAVRANQYRNFQIRIVEDTTTPTSVGQRANITSHTAGASPVYTVPTWGVTPSSSAKFVIELNDNRILMWGSASTATSTYSISGDAWDSNTTFVARGTATGAGCKAEIAFGIVPDSAGNVNNGMIYCLRGGASSAIDVLDITAATTGTWSNAITYGNSNQTYTTGTCQAYDPVSNQGRYLYLNVSGGQRNMRFDLLNRTMEAWAYFNYNQSTAVVGERSFMKFYIDPNSTAKLGEWCMERSSSNEVYGVTLQR